jgi:hypothetical protein
MTRAPLCLVVRYVRHERVPYYLRCGWMFVASLGPTHGEWSVLLGWLCRCDPVEPLE